MKAVKKPIPIDYLSYIGNLNDVVKWVKGFGDSFFDNFLFTEIPEALYVKTKEGTSYEITTNDVIIRGVKGEYYPCKKDIFRETYDIVTPDDIKSAQKFIKECNADLGFIGSPEYFEKKKMVEDYINSIQL